MQKLVERAQPQIQTYAWAHVVVAVLFAVFLLTPLLTRAAVVELDPSDDVESIVANGNPGDTYRFASGTYRLLSIEPNEGDTFIGEPGAVLNGSALLTGWTATTTGSTTLWYVEGQTQQGHATGVCDPLFPRCTKPEDVFVNDEPLRHVDSLANVDEDSYYFDYDNDRIYLGADPTGKTVEVATAALAFRNTAENVTVRGLTIEKYATPAQRGTIGSDSSVEGWVIEENTLQLNHGGAANIGTSTVLRNNRIIRNGQIGFGGKGSDLVISGNEIAYNNYAGFDDGWEAGGFKIALSENLLARNNYVHDNKGPGLWTDIDNIFTTYAYNTVVANHKEGIKHEISWEADVHDNITIDNGFGHSTWVWGANIIVQNSSDVEVYDNYVKVGASAGRGITVLEQNRGTGAFGPWVSKNAYVHDNDIIHPTASGISGADNDYGNQDFLTSAWNIQFDGNRYHLANANNANMYWGGSLMNLTDMQNVGQELNGTADANTSLAPPAPQVILSAADEKIEAGDSTELSFEGLLATECSAPWKIGTWVSGTVRVSPTTTTQYEVECTGLGGTATSTVTVEVTPAPIAHWTFDDGSGTTAADARGNHHGTLTSEDVAWTSGVDGGALDFDGGYVSIPNESAFDFTSDFTVSLWMKTNDFGHSWSSLISKGDSAWSITNYDGDPVANFNTWDSSGPDDLAGTSEVDDDQWHHVVAVYDGSEKKLYLDGSLHASASYTAPISTNDYPVRIGDNAEYSPGEYLGFIDDVRIYDVPLDADAVAALYEAVDVPPAVWVASDPTETISGAPVEVSWTTARAESCTSPDFSTNSATSGSATVHPTETTTYSVVCTGEGATVATGTVEVKVVDPLAHWTFDDGSGSTASEELGNFDGTLTGSSISWTTGIDGGALDFDGGYVVIPNESAFDFTGNFSISLWMKTDDFGHAWSSLISKGDSAWSITNYNGNPRLDFNTWADDEPDDLVGSTDVDDGAWHHVAVVYDGAQKTLYLDGAPHASRTYTETLDTNNYPVRIGDNAEYSPGEYTGLMDDVRVYDRPLSAAEVETLYESIQ